ncbi:MAG: glycerophosphodiester phosphodiesterase [Nitrospira sp.]|nr:glycerophosphodiester phosphodiesterase [Nitrospira sp.]
MFLKVGHRGAKAYEIENTLESYKKAIELGANAIELDVRKSHDGELIVIHDDNLKRVFGKDIPVNQTTLKELKQLTGDKIPTLEQALQFLDKKVERILVELKEVSYEKMALEVIKKEDLNERVIIVSFHEPALLNVRELDDKIETGLIYAKHKNPIDTALKLKAQYLVPLYKLTHMKNIEDAHKNNLKVIVWTINTKHEAKQYRDKGVDGIASDKPDIL